MTEPLNDASRWEWPMQTSIEVSLEVAQRQGLRVMQEDAYVMARVSTGHLLAVCDGHGGPEVAQQAIDQLVGCFTDALVRQRASHGEEGMVAIEQAFVQVVAALQAECTASDCGSTLTLAHVGQITSGRKPALGVTIANLGDSGAALLTPDHTLFRTEPHSVTTHHVDVEAILAQLREAPDDRVRVGMDYLHKVTRCGVCGLALTRALGDRQFDPYLRREADVASHVVPVGSVLALYSDGLYSPRAVPSEADRIHSVLQQARAGTAAHAILDRIIEEDGGRRHDNTTLLLFTTRLESNDADAAGA